MNNTMDTAFFQGTTIAPGGAATPASAQATNTGRASVSNLIGITSPASGHTTAGFDPRSTTIPGTKSLRKPGVMTNSFVCEMDAVEYHNGSPGISSSRMKHMLVSPAVYQLKLHRPMQETDALRVGRMLHTQVLEPHLVSSDFAIWQDGRRQGNEWALFAMQNAKKTIITEPQMACVERMAEALQGLVDFPLSAWLAGIKGQGSQYDIAPAIKEQSLFWIDEDTGLQCKARPDAMTLGSKPLVGDLKSARSADEDDFISDIFKYRYDVQAAHYLAGVKAVYGIDAPFAFFAVEKEEPHVARTFLMTPDALAHGERLRRYCLRMIRRCLDTGSWPKQPPGTKPVSVEVPFMSDNPFKDMAAGYGIEF
jgi:hypothetical protein